MDEQIRNNDEIEIDLLEIVRLLISKVWIIIASFIIGAVIFALGTKIILTPQYSATSMIYILSKSTSITSLAEIQVGAQATIDVQTLAVSRPVLETVIEDLNLDISYEELVKKVSMMNPDSSLILKMTVEDANPKLAKKIANSWAEAAADQVAKVMVTDKPNIVEEAVTPKDPSSPSTVKNTAIGALLGLLLAIGIIVVRFLLDDTVKTEEDIKKYLGLNVLAAIPIEGQGDSRKSPKSKGLKKTKSIKSKNGKRI